ncbi:NAD+ synthase [[Eubacterium] cellulosolvens]
MRIAMAQINSIVGDLSGNIKKIEKYIEKAKEQGVDLIAFPELAVTGYPPQDLLLEKNFVRENKQLLEELVKNNTGITGIVGFVDYDHNNLFNAAMVFDENKFVGVVYKTLLPTYDVFDEDRYFETSKEVSPISLSIGRDEIKIGVEICEDLWDEGYDLKVTDLLAKKGADLIINISASPFYTGKRFVREGILKKKSTKIGIPIFYVNLVGGQDELVFDGQSLALDKLGNLIAIGKQFGEDLVVTTINLQKKVAKRIKPPAYNREQEIFNALVLGIRDYFKKTGFQKAIIGLSGGIDSSLTAAIAVEALSKENVIGLSMPSRFSSEHSKNDVQQLVENLEIPFIQFSIQEIVYSYQKELENPLELIRKHFVINREGDDPIADENIQARIRGNCLMYVSNLLKDLKILVLNTGNKTELALGYCTLYGDMTGGIGVISDLSKLEVYKIARYVNEKAEREIIPETVFMKRPSAELKEGQFDPFDYNIVSPLVDEIIENRRNKQELIEMGYSRETVKDTYKRIRNAEYKRWQAAPGIKVTPKAFGVGWKMPIVNKYLG